MKIGEYEIKPISVYLPDSDDWATRDALAKEYFVSQGIADIEWIAGIHAEKWGITGRHIYLLDDRPKEQFYIGDKKVGGFLTQYVVYNVMQRMDYTHFMFLETDCEFVDGWKEKLDAEMSHVPPDFDFLFVGSCCAADKQPIHVGGDVYHFPYRGEEKWTWYPQCAQCYIVSRKCLQVLIDTQRDVASPADISLIKYAFPKLNIYAILPRLAGQCNTNLPE